MKEPRLGQSRHNSKSLSLVCVGRLKVPSSHSRVVGGREKPGNVKTF